MAEEKSIREQQVEERERRVAETNPPLERVRVTPASDDLRRLLVHPTGIGFPENTGSVEWPLDKFTRRRIEDGSVTREDAGRNGDRRVPREGRATYQQPGQPAQPDPNAPQPDPNAPPTS
jgi:hypothetical protein